MIKVEAAATLTELIQNLTQILETEGDLPVADTNPDTGLRVRIYGEGDEKHVSIEYFS